jgi:hypothetical protein
VSAGAADYEFCRQQLTSRDLAVTGAVIDGLIASSVSAGDPLLQTVIIRRLPLAVIERPSPDRLNQQLAVHT